MRFDADKMRALVLYVAGKQQDDYTFDRVKLAQLLFSSDFSAYGYLGAPITGADYHRLPTSPVARQFPAIRRQLFDRGLAHEEERGSYGYPRPCLVPHEEADLSGFRDGEIQIIDTVISQYRGEYATRISEVSSDEIGWQVAHDGELIPYPAVFVGHGTSPSISARVAKIAAGEHWASALETGFDLAPVNRVRPTAPLATWEDPAYMAQVALLGDLRRLEDQLTGVTWVIAHDPRSLHDAGNDLWFVTTRMFPDVPPLLVLFTIDDGGGTVTLRWVEPI